MPPSLFWPVSMPTTRTRVAPAMVPSVTVWPTLAWVARATAGPSTTPGTAAEPSAAVSQRPALSRYRYRASGPRPSAR